MTRVTLAALAALARLGTPLTEEAYRARRRLLPDSPLGFRASRIAEAEAVRLSVLAHIAGWAVPLWDRDLLDLDVAEVWEPIVGAALVDAYARAGEAEIAAWMAERTVRMRGREARTIHVGGTAIPVVARTRPQPVAPEQQARAEFHAWVRALPPVPQQDAP
jgi:hypothetical protein